MATGIMHKSELRTLGNLSWEIISKIPFTFVLSGLNALNWIKLRDEPKVKIRTQFASEPLAKMAAAG
jgi:hypothetical protein